MVSLDARLVHFYRPESHYDLCDGMIVTGFSDEFQFTWNRPDGTVERVVTLDREPLPFTSEDETAFMRQLDAMAQEANAPPERIADYKARLRFTSTYPAYRRFVCGPAGTLLVQRIRPLRELSEDELERQGTGQRAPASEEWDAFDREGRYLGIAPLPVPPHRHAFTKDTSGVWLMCGIERGELDVPYAAVWEMYGIEQ